MADPAPAPLACAMAVALTHKAIRKLPVTQYGAVMALIISALLEEFNPFEASHQTLGRNARCTPKQWIMIREGVMGALRIALPDVMAVYIKRAETAKKRAYNAKISLKASWDKKRKTDTKLETQSFELVDQSFAPSILQPVKAPHHKPENSDIHAWKKAKANKNKGIALHD